MSDNSSLRNSLSFTAIGFLGLAVMTEAYFLWDRTRKSSERIKNLQLELNRYKELREVERRGRISSQQKSRNQLSKLLNESGYCFQAIARVESPFPDRRGTPRQPLLVRAAKGKIRFIKQLVQFEAFKELSDFSHVWVIFVFHRNTNADSIKINAKIKPPRLHGAKVGCLSTRSPHRPNNVGLSVCEVVSIGKDYIEVLGLDIVDGTPILDVKPYVPCDSVPLDPMHLQGSYSQCLHTRQLMVPSWIVEEDIIKRPVTFTAAARVAIEDLVQDGETRISSSAEEAIELITQVLHQDIRGVHQGRGKESQESTSTSFSGFVSSEDHEHLVSPSNIYQCNLDKMLIHFTTLADNIMVLNVEKMQLPPDII